MGPDDRIDIVVSGDSDGNLSVEAGTRTKSGQGDRDEDSLMPGDLNKTRDKAGMPRSDGEETSSEERLFFGKPFGKNRIPIVNFCRHDGDCPPPQKCCLMQMALYVCRDTCRYPSNVRPYY